MKKKTLSAFINMTGVGIYKMTRPESIMASTAIGIGAAIAEGMNSNDFKSSLRAGIYAGAISMLGIGGQMMFKSIPVVVDEALKEDNED